MKYLTLIILSLSFTTYAQEVPEFLKDGTITVTLKNGKTHTFSANEYAVVKRQAKPQVKIAESSEVMEVARINPSVKSESKRHKHIISGEVLSSRNGELKDSADPSHITVKTRRKVGVGIMYQNNIYKDLYLGGRIDSNGGAGLNIGLGF